MMSILKVKKNNVEQTINLKEEFGIDFSGKDELKQLMGQAIIDKIIKRTASGKGVSLSANGSGRSVKLKSPYSKSYTKSEDFLAAGKSKNKVNMELTGDMMGLIDIKKISGNSITIGWNDADENPKAFNHMTGDTVPKRPFFGVSNKELKDIKSKFKDDLDKAIKTKQNEGVKAFNEMVLGLLDDLDAGKDKA